MEIDGYQDLVEIGRGGYAVVYRAHQAAFGRPVAIKVLTTSGLGETERLRFEREALAMGRLSWHPNIVVVHETGTTEAGLPYLVEEYLEGGSLGDKLRRTGPLDVADAVAAVVQLAAAVHTAHEADLLHRDIKPDNALIDAFGRIKLADFGIAAVADSTLTATGLVTATIAHAAPEVLNGAKATPRADIYSLGSTLYELLTRTPAFVREGEESIVPLVVRVTNEPVPDLTTLGVPGPVADVVEAAMAKAPDARPASALELGQLLQSAQQQLGLRPTDLAVRGTPESRHDDTIVGGPVPVVAATPPPAPDPPANVSNETIDTPAPPAPLPSVTTETPSAAAAASRTGTVATPAPAPPVAPTDPAGGSKAPLVLGVLVVLALVAGGFLLLSGGDDGGAGDDTTDTAADGPPDADDAEVVTIDTGPRPFRIAVGDTVAWVTDNDASTVDVIDLETNTVVETVDIGGEPVGVTLVDGTAWVANATGGTIVPIDAQGQAGTPIPVGGNPRTIAATDDALWVTLLDDDAVARVDRDTGTVTTTIVVGDEPRGVVADDGGVWVVNRRSGDLSRIDPATNGVVATIPIGGLPGTLTLTDEAVWVADAEQDVIVQVDRADNSVLATIPVGGDPGGFASTGDTVYVSRSATTEVTVIDAASAEVVDTIAVGTQPAGLAVTDTELWVANSGANTVSRIPLD